MKVFVLTFDEDKKFFGVYLSLFSAQVQMRELEAEFPEQHFWIYEVEAKQ